MLEPDPNSAGRHLDLGAGSTRSRLVRLAYRFLWNQDDAEDAVQDALLTAQAKWRDLRDKDKGWSWVCRIVVNRCHQQARLRQRHRHHEQYIRPRNQEADAGHHDAAYTKEVVRQALAGLSGRQRDVMVLRHLENMSYADIAAVLHISPATARVHAKAGREALRDIVLANHPDWFDQATRKESNPR